MTGYAVRRHHLVRRETELTTLTLRADEVGVALDHAERRLRRRGDCHLNSLLDVSAAAPSGSAAGYPRSRGVGCGEHFIRNLLTPRRSSFGLSERSSFFDADIPAAPDPTPALPDPPRDLTARAAGETLVVLSWTAPEGGDASSILGYRIEVSADGGTGS